MSISRSIFGRAYRLKPNPGPGPGHVSQLRIGGVASGPSRLLPLPYSSGLGYFVVPANGTALSIESEDFRAKRLGFLRSLWVRLRLALLFKRKKYLRFEEFSVFSFGVKPERKRFTGFNQQMSNIGLALDGDLVKSHPELLVGWPTVDHEGRAAAAPGLSNAVAIVVHIYYEDTWTEVAAVLRRLDIQFDLIVTTVPDRDRLVQTIRHDFPHAEVQVMENRGRDVRPFLELLEQGRLDRYRYVCKIHGKKSNDGGRASYMGSIWRRRLMFDLLAAPGIARAIVSRFESDAIVGMIGPRLYRLPNDSIPLDPWGENRATVLELAEKMGIAPDRFRLDFFGGTMFWVRPEALRPLRELRLASAFPQEQGLLDGGLEHVTERLFAAAVVAAGYQLADSDGQSVSEA